MKNTILFIGFAMIAVSLSSCDSKENASKDEIKTEENSEQANEPIESISDDKLSVEEIDKMRNEIESLKTEAIEISTATLREKIKQKWSKIHVYVENDVVVKIKTYPYSQISKRTEEFYANEEGLCLVVIEDNGDEPKGKSKSEIDRMYYFQNDELIGELKKGKEQDFKKNKSASERLVSEFNDYLEIYENNKK